MRMVGGSKREGWWVWEIWWFDLTSNSALGYKYGVTLNPKVAERIRLGYFTLRDVR